MNHGPADRLIEAKGDVAARIEVHAAEMTDGVMRMRKVSGGLALPADGEVAMKPGGYHVMLMGLAAPPTEGGSFPVTLLFESGAEMTVDVPVIARGGEAPSAHLGRHEAHSGHTD